MPPSSEYGYSDEAHFHEGDTIFEAQSRGYRRKNPVREANELFDTAINYPILIGFAADTALRSLHRVIPAFLERGSSVWKRMLSGDPDDIVSHMNTKGFELARLFLTTDYISAQPEVQGVYADSRSEIAKTLREYFFGRSMDQISDIEKRIGLRLPLYQQTVSLRRPSGEVH